MGFGRTAIVLMAVLLLTPSNHLHAKSQTHIEGDFSFWWDIYEQNENGILQAGTREPAADVTSGFNLKQARITLHHRDSSNSLSTEFQIRLEERVAILDCYVAWQPSKTLRLLAGQMKVPSTYEALASDRDLDFISRTSLASNLTDWSLSRTPYFSAFYGNRSYHRDLGLGFTGKLDAVTNLLSLSYFGMVGNGLGANLFIGGTESKEFIFTNNPGDCFYGVRLDASVWEHLYLGGHYSQNTHDAMVFNDEKTVFGLDRSSWSADARIEAHGVEITGMTGGGFADDDYFYTEQKKLEYSGWELKCLTWVVPHYLQLGLRWDGYTREFASGATTCQRNITFGANGNLGWRIRLQMNYTIKETKSDTEPDLDDNILLLNLQAAFG